VAVCDSVTVNVKFSVPDVSAVIAAGVATVTDGRSSIVPVAVSRAAFEFRVTCRAGPGQQRDRECRRRIDGLLKMVIGIAAVVAPAKMVTEPLVTPV